LDLKMMSRETIESAAANVASKATFTGAGASIVGYASEVDWGFWAGVVIGLAGLVVNWYFKRRSDRRAQEAHKAFLLKLEKHTGPLELLHEAKDD